MSNILILEPSTSGLALLPNAKQMGLTVFVLSADSDERIIPEEYRQYIRKLIKVDTNDLEAISKATLQLHQEFPLSAIIPGFEIYVAHAARLSQLIKVRGVSAETGDALRNKGNMRSVLQQAGINVPRFVIIDAKEKLLSIENELTFPCVIKPIDQSGSMHVSRVNNLEELQQAYALMCQDSWTEMGKGIGSIAIVEEYIEGKEYSVEGFVDDEGIHIISVTEKLLGPEPFFVEMGHIVPADIDSKSFKMISDYVHAVIHAIDMNVGVFHCELRMMQEKPVLMEISGRLAGDKICDLIYLASGINLYQLMLQCYLGQKISFVSPAFSRAAGIHYFSCLNKPSYSKLEGLEELQATPGFYDFKVSIPANQAIPSLSSFLGRVGYCIFTAETNTELKTRFALADTLLKFI